MDLSAIASFDRGTLAQQETRVTRRDGSCFVERRSAEGAVQEEYLGQVAVPEFLAEHEAGYSTLLPKRWSETAQEWMTAAPKPGDTAEPEPAPSQLELITYNVWFSERNFGARARALGQILAARSADVVCLQEVTPELVQLVREQAWIRAEYCVTDVTGATCVPYGVLMLSKRTPRRVRLHFTPSNMGRRALVAEFAGVTVATMHLESLANREYREAQIAHVLPLLPADAPAVFCGDCNFGAGAPEEAAFGAEFADAWPALHGADPGLTHDEGRLDRVWLRGAQPLAIELLGTEPISPQLRPPTERPSDHNGLWASVSLSSPAGGAAGGGPGGTPGGAGGV